MEIKAEDVILILPTAVSLLITTEKNKLFVGFGIAFGLVCLFSAYTYGAWIGAFVGLLLFFLIGEVL